MGLILARYSKFPGYSAHKICKISSVFFPVFVNINQREKFFLSHKGIYPCSIATGQMWKMGLYPSRNDTCMCVCVCFNYFAILSNGKIKVDKDKGKTKFFQGDQT